LLTNCLQLSLGKSDGRVLDTASHENEIVSLRDTWEQEAAAYLEWARTPGHDIGFWNYNLPALLSLLPEPGTLTVDVGCGEGRLGRELAKLGHRLVGLDASALLADAAATHPEAQATILALLQSLPLVDRCADLITASMVLMDVDDIARCFDEIARVLVPGGCLCFSIMHPLNTAGDFTHRDDPDAPFVLSESYFVDRRRTRTFSRNDRRMTFSHVHRPLGEYFSAMYAADLLVERLFEPRVDSNVGAGDPNWQRWNRVPNTLHVRAVRRH